MTRYYEEAGITIYCEDCRDVLAELPRVDLVLTDPPYGIGFASHVRGSDRELLITGDEEGDLGASVLEAAAYESYPVIAFASPMKPWPGQWRQYLVWDKGPAVGGGGDVARCWKQTWELIQIARTGILQGQRDSAVLRFWVTPDDAALHPAQKPEALIRYLMEKTTCPGDLILDPFMGSGTTLVAAKQLGRRAIGIEIERRYCDIAIERLRQDVLPLEAVGAPVATQDSLELAWKP